MLLDGLGDILALREVEELTTLDRLVPFDPGILAVVEAGNRVSDNLERLGFFANGNDITGHNSERGDIYALTVNADVLVEHELARSGASRSEAEAIDNVIEAAFEELEEHLTCNTFSAFSLLKEIAELTFEHTVSVLSFLFFAQLSAILRSFLSAILTMLAGGEVSSCENLILAINRLAEFARDFCFWTCVSCHYVYNLAHP